MSTLKWGQRSSSTIIGAFLQTGFLFFSGPTTRCFLNSKVNMLVINGTSLEASLYGFYKDKHRKLCAILTEILPQFG